MFVESDQRAAAVIGQNIKTLGVAARRCGAAPSHRCSRREADHPVDLVLADPPYDVDAAEIEEMLGELTTRGWAAGGTVAVVERAASGATAAVGRPGWAVWPERKYGDTRLEMAQLERTG